MKQRSMKDNFPITLYHSTIIKYNFQRSVRKIKDSPLDSHNSYYEIEHYPMSYVLILINHSIDFSSKSFS